MSINIRDRDLRIGIALGVVVEGEAVQNQGSTLGDEHSVVHEIFG